MTFGVPHSLSNVAIESALIRAPKLAGAWNIYLSTVPVGTVALLVAKNVVSPS